VAGKEEFRGRLGVTGDRQAQICIDDMSCLARAAVSLGVRRIVAGHVGARGKQYLFNLALNNVETGKVDGRVFRLVDGGVEDLIRAVQDASRSCSAPGWSRAASRSAPSPPAPGSPSTTPTWA
jgi:hypothetical protein